MDTIALLSATLSPVGQERVSATDQLASILQANPAQYLQSLSHVLADPATPSHLRNAAGLAIKNSLSAREAPRQEEYAARWKALDPQTRDRIKLDALTTLGAADKGARNVAGQVVAAVAAIELPLGLWNDLISRLLELVGSNDNSGLRQATLQAIGYICESIVSSLIFVLGPLETDAPIPQPETGSTRVSVQRDLDGSCSRGKEGGNEVPSISCSRTYRLVLTRIRSLRHSVEVRLAAVNALYNSLEFVKENFVREVCQSNLYIYHSSANIELLVYRLSVITSCKSYARQRNLLPPNCRSPPLNALFESCTFTTTS